MKIEPGTRVRSTEDEYPDRTTGTYMRKGYEFHRIHWDSSEGGRTNLHAEEEFEVIGMSEYTPTTEDIRNAAAPWSVSAVHFDRWLASVKSEAWDEGHDQGWQSRKEFDLDGAAEWRNPYREESK